MRDTYLCNANSLINIEWVRETIQADGLLGFLRKQKPQNIRIERKDQTACGVRNLRNTLKPPNIQVSTFEQMLTQGI